MPDYTRRRSALAAVYVEGSEGEPGLAISERRPLSMVQVAAFPGHADAVRQAAGVHLPARPGSADAAGICALWLGRDRWLLVGSEPDLSVRLARGIGVEDGSVVDLGQARTVLRVSGPRAREVLAHGTGIDLHLDAFGPGACASTLLGHVAAILHCVAADCIDVYLPRSYAQTAWEWLLEVAARHGRRVEEVSQ